MKWPRQRHFSDKGSQNPPLKQRLSSQESRAGLVGGMGTMATLVWLLLKPVELCMISWSLALVICKTCKLRNYFKALLWVIWKSLQKRVLFLEVSRPLGFLMVFLQLLGCFDPKIELGTFKTKLSLCCLWKCCCHSIVVESGLHSTVSLSETLLLHLSN